MPSPHLPHCGATMCLRADTEPTARPNLQGHCTPCLPSPHLDKLGGCQPPPIPGQAMPPSACSELDVRTARLNRTGRLSETDPQQKPRVVPLPGESLPAFNNLLSEPKVVSWCLRLWTVDLLVSGRLWYVARSIRLAYRGGNIPCSVQT